MQISTQEMLEPYPQFESFYCSISVTLGKLLRFLVPQFPIKIGLVIVITS